MTLLSYQVFQTVVGQGSFQKAAEILNLTPSAVSHAIASMEQELGFSLFTRNKAGVALTNYGEHLLPYVNAVLNSDESLQQAIAGLKGMNDVCHPVCAYAGKTAHLYISHFQSVQSRNCLLQYKCAR